MCGIFGYVGLGVAKSAGEVRKLKNALSIISYRGPDNSSFKVFPSGEGETFNIFLGHNRLAIIDLSEAGNQPLSISGNYHIVFNGEIKNIGGRRADFVKMDFVFRKNWSGETRTLTTFIQGSYNTFDSGIVSDASLLPGALGKFELYVPQDFGSFIGYSYVIDWEEYQ